MATDLPSTAPAGSPPLEPLDSGDASRLREIAEDLDAYEHGPTWRGDRDYLRELATRVSQLSALREENEQLKNILCTVRDHVFIADLDVLEGTGTV